MRADFHTHSRYSFDGDPASTIPALCEAAIAAGFSHLAITDHCDVGSEMDGLLPPLDRDTVFAEITKAKETYKGQLVLLAGIELGEAHHHPKEARAVLERHPYDIVLGALHNLNNEPDFFYMDFANIDEAQTHAYFDRVLKECIEMLDFSGIHVLAHLTYLHRYVRRGGKDMDFTPHFPRMRILFEKMIAKGVALELNASSIGADGEGVPMPTKELLAFYRNCGGRLVSLGSDGHAPSAIGRYFEHAVPILRDCGFAELAVPTAQGLLTLPL